jgi:hypothetical protein
MILVDNLPKDAITFWYNTNQPRNNQGKKEALERWKKWKINNGGQFVKSKGNPKSKKRTDRSFYHSLHHISGERSNGKAENLFVCETGDQHEKLEMQLKQLQIELVNSGIIGFAFDAKKYFVAWKPLADKILQWRNKK